MGPILACDHWNNLGTWEAFRPTLGHPLPLIHFALRALTQTRTDSKVPSS